MEKTISTRARIIAAASIIAVAGVATTFAAFTDSGAIATDLSAGTLDLKFDDNQDGNPVAYEVPFSSGSDNLKPGDEVTMDVEVFNSGSVSATLDLALPQVTNSAGAPVEALEDIVELTITDGTTTLYSGALSGAEFQDLAIGANGAQGAGTTLYFTAAVPTTATTAIAGQDLAITMPFTANQA